MRFLVPPTQGTGRSPSLSGRGHRQSQESHLESEIKPGEGLKSLEAGKGLVLPNSVCPVTHMKLTALKMSHKRAGKKGMGGEGWGRRKGPRVGSFTSHDPFWPRRHKSPPPWDCSQAFNLKPPLYHSGGYSEGSVPEA